ncbi:MAG: 50S ribosomal protein L29 [Verrucomicrobiia bacterium]|jgi:large subunit ribosomal protein L29
MKPKEIREMTEAEAQAKLRDLQQELFNLRLHQQTARLERPSRMREVRHDIARVETILRERQLQTAKASK